MGIYSAVACAEVHDTQSESWTLDGVSMSVDLHCAWADRHLLVADLIENARPWPHGGFANPPVAQAATIVPFAAEGFGNQQSLDYDNATVSVQYGTDTGDDLVSESLEPTAEFITLDYKWYRWGSIGGDPLADGESPGKLRRGLTIARTLYKLSSLPTIILTGIGGVNHQDYVSGLLGLTFEKETLLFQPPVANRTIKTDGSEGWTLATKFMFKPEGWNKYWRAKTETYEEMYDIRGSGQPVKNYPLVNFSSILF